VPGFIVKLGFTHRKETSLCLLLLIGRSPASQAQTVAASPPPATGSAAPADKFVPTPPATAYPNLKSQRLSFGLEQNDQSGRLRRHTAFASYENQVRLLLQRHQLEATGFKTPASTASDVSVGGSYDFSSGFRLDGAVGLFSSDHATATFEMLFHSETQGSLVYDFKLQRAPLALFYQLLSKESHATRDSFSAEVGYASFVTAELTVARDHTFAPHEKYALNFTLPLFSQQDRPSVDVKVPLAFENHPKPSPFYTTYPNIYSAGVELKLSAAVSSSWQTASTVTYGIISRSSFEDVKKFDLADSISASSRVTYRYAQDFELGVKAAFSSERPRGADQRHEDELGLSTFAAAVL
jgi:hypothetical protein